MSTEQILAVLAGVATLVGGLVKAVLDWRKANDERRAAEREAERQERLEFVPRSDVEAMREEHARQMREQQERHDRQLAELRADFDSRLEKSEARLAAREEELRELQRLVRNLTALDRPNGHRDRVGDGDPYGPAHG